MIKWVLPKKVTDEIGYTKDAINAKIKNGVWIEGLHWRKAPDGRRLLNLGEIQKWVEQG